MDANDPRAVAFKRAAESADAAEIRSLFDAHPELGDVVDAPWFSFGRPALLYVARAENRDAIDALLDAGANIDAKSDWSAGPYGILDGIVDTPAPVDVELADYLIGRGATLDIHAAVGGAWSNRRAHRVTRREPRPRKRTGAGRSDPAASGDERRGRAVPARPERGD